MNEMGQVLRSWLLGQLVRSAVVAVVLAVILYLLGLPGAPLLGLQAGAANFIPYLGPLIAAFPVALVAMPLGLSTLAWVMAIYFAIQTIEGFVVAPLIQKGSVNVAPAWTLFAIVIFGALFGALGVALAAPLLAVGRIAVLRFYVEDWLKDRGGRRGNSASSRARAHGCRDGLVDPSENVGEERIGRDAQQRVEVDDQHAAFAAR